MNYNNYLCRKSICSLILFPGRPSSVLVSKDKFKCNKITQGTFFVSFIIINKKFFAKTSFCHITDHSMSVLYRNSKDIIGKKCQNLQTV